MAKLITTPQTLTNIFANLGDRLVVDKYRILPIALKIAENDSKDVILRCLIKTIDSDELFPLTIHNISVDGENYVTKEEIRINDFIDGKTLMHFNLPDNAEMAQVQIKVLEVGATAGIITEANSIQSYNADKVGEENSLGINYGIGQAPKSVTVTNISQIVIPANHKRKILFMTNTGPQDIFIAIGHPAEMDKGILIEKSSGRRTLDSGKGSKQAIYGITSAMADSNIIYQELI